MSKRTDLVSVGLSIVLATAVIVAVALHAHDWSLILIGAFVGLVGGRILNLFD